MVANVAQQGGLEKPARIFSRGLIGVAFVLVDVLSKPFTRSEISPLVMPHLYYGSIGCWVELEHANRYTLPERLALGERMAYQKIRACLLGSPGGTTTG